MEARTDGQKWDFPLGSLPDEDLDWLRENGEILDVPPGTAVLTAGEKNEAVYIILEGEMSWYITPNPRGCLALLLAVIWPVYRPYHQTTPCDFGGDGTFLYPGRAVATLKAAGPSKVLSVSHESLRAHCDEDLGFSARFHRMIAQYCVLRDRYEKAGGVEQVEPGEGSRRALARLLSP